VINAFGEMAGILWQNIRHPVRYWPIWATVLCVTVIAVSAVALLPQR
jgi:hypothetical protein